MMFWYILIASIFGGLRPENHLAERPPRKTCSCARKSAWNPLRMSSRWCSLAIEEIAIWYQLQPCFMYTYIYIGLSFLIHKWLKLPFGCSFAMQPLAKYAEVSKHGASRAKKESQERTECVSGQGYRALMGSVWPKKMGGNQRTSPWHRRTKWESVNGKIMSNGKISYIFIEGL